MNDSELSMIKKHIEWGWHDDKGNNDVQKLFDEIIRLRTVAAEARKEGIEAMRDVAEEGQVVLEGHVVVPLNYLKNRADRLLAEMQHKEGSRTSNLGFDQLRHANVSRCEEVFHNLHDWSPTDWATAMAGECGEACNQIKKLRRLDGADSLLDSAESRSELHLRIAKELADMVIYADLLAARLEINLGAAIVQKFDEVSHERGSSIFLGGQAPQHKEGE